MSSPLTLAAPAKINLSLEVLARRSDGFHEVRMLMASVSLRDELDFEPAETLSLVCDRPGLDCGEGNLILKAARVLQKALGRTPGARIALRKRIPMGGGLAGGSTDAAAALKGLNHLWEGGLGSSELERLAATLGSDIPFCLEGTWAYATGRGEQLERLNLAGPLHFVLLNPGFEVSTQWVYQNLPKPEPSQRNHSADTYAALSKGDWQALEKAAKNDLEPVTSGAFPEIQRMKQDLLRQGALLSRMSGSGPTVWGLFPGINEAKQAAKALEHGKTYAFAVQSLA